MVQEFFDRDAFMVELLDALEAIDKGYSVAEIDGETSERDWMPKHLVHRLPQRFDFDRDTGEQLLLRAEHGWEPLQLYKFVTGVTKLKSGIPIRGDLARGAAWLWAVRVLHPEGLDAFRRGLRAPVAAQETAAQRGSGDKAVL